MAHRPPRHQLTVVPAQRRSAGASRAPAGTRSQLPVVAPVRALLTGFLIDGLGLHRTLLMMTAGAVLTGVAAAASRGVRLLDTRPGPTG